MSERPLPTPRPDPLAELRAIERAQLPHLQALFDNPADESARAALRGLNDEHRAKSAELAPYLRPPRKRRKEIAP